MPVRQIHLVNLGPVQNRISFECTNFSAMSQKPLSEIIRQAEKHLAQGVHPNELEHLLGRGNFTVWEKEAQPGGLAAGHQRGGNWYDLGVHMLHAFDKEVYSTCAEAMGDAYFGFYLHAMGRGRPRRVAELRAMLNAAGFDAVRAVPTHLPLQTQVLVARRARENPVP